MSETSKNAGLNGELDSGDKPASPPRTYLTDEELEHFRQLILKKRTQALEEIEDMNSRLKDAQEQTEGYTYHMADSGTDAMEREMLYLMISRQQKYIGYLDRALKRIDLKTYGICKITGKPIPKERLDAVPHTETTVEAKIEQKKKGM
ncbi:MAG: TraR/DksA family transcriptional regulator [Calditrichaeota bacterium]|nr:TraR/DksA family transcriptional regulator [Calditrichota bacterium]MCB0269435.1 TraR/DksA family transcriptional regulator [Calditrichota bacterium]MCB0299616.1 TraR/DksA family transcriptional regulator [Calditrichota bacterium]MCB9069116.1 TraR/DksA family transcriptional regulator [Calditrichia bacterium]